MSRHLGDDDLGRRHAARELWSFGESPAASGSTLLDARGGIPAPAGLRRWLPWLTAWLTLLPLPLLRAGTMTEPDTFWEIRSGLEILRRGAIPSVDSFSWTAAGRPWTLNSWLFDVLLGAGYRAGGLPLVALIGAALIAAVLGLALLLGCRLGASPVLAATVLWLSSPLVLAWLSVRPQLVDYAGVLLLVLLLLALARAADPMPALVAIGVLTVLWVNLHAAAVFELGIVVGASVLTMVLRPVRARRSRYVATVAVAIIGCLLNPYGVAVLTQTASVQSASAGVVTEWQPANPLDPSQAMMLLTGLAALVLALRRRDPVIAAALLVSGGGALLAIRLLPVLWLLAAPVVAAACSRPTVVRYLRSRGPVVALAAVLAPVAMLAMAAPGLVHLGRPNPTLYPDRAVVQAIPAECRVFNTYLQGGLLLLERPDVLVSVDSRNDLYGPAAVLAGARALTARTPDAVPAAAGCALLPPTSRLAAALAADPAWVRTAGDGTAVLFLRT